MDESIKRQAKISYGIALAIGAFCRTAPVFLGLSWGSGILTFIWVSAFLYLCCEFRHKKSLRVTALVFCITTWLKDVNSLGLFWTGLILYLGAGLVLLGVFLLYSHVLSWRNHILTTLLFPVLWIIAYLAATVLRVPTPVRIDAMFIDQNVMIQAENLIGSLGLMFVLLWSAALLEFAARNRNLKIAAVSGLILLVPLIIGIIDLYPNITYQKTVKAAYSTGPYIGDFLNYEDLPIEDYQESYERSVKKAAEEGAGILVFNEEAFGVTDQQEPDFLEFCAEKAKENSIHVLVGMDVRDTDGSEGGKSKNQIVWFSSKGEQLASYQKAMPIPVLEDGYVRGEQVIPSLNLTIDGQPLTVSFLICYDSNFPLYVKKMNPDTDILFLPSWDWKGITDLHSMLCRAISVENRVTILKPTYDGISIGVDPYGRIIHESSTAESGYEQVHTVDLPIRSAGVLVETPKKAPFVFAIIATELFSILICLILLYGNHFENAVRTERVNMFSVLIITNIVALVSDAVSWILDGCSNLHTILFITTFLSMTLIYVLGAEFIAYLTALIRERREMSSNFTKVYQVISVVMILVTFGAYSTGNLFTFNNGVFTEGSLYSIYVFCSACSIIYGLLVIIKFREALGTHDSRVAYLYMAIPFLSACINLFIPEFSYIYPAITLSMIIVYAMIQSDRVEMLEQEGITNNYYAMHDKLTGLNNRRAYDEKLQQLSHYDGVVGIVYSDLNGLKHANDTYGHVAGDQLITNYTNTLCGVFRREETYRIGGDEFVVILPDMKEDVFEARVHHFCELLNAGGKPLACLGYAHGRGQDIQELLKDSEEQMYVEKELFHKMYPETKR